MSHTSLPLAILRILFADEGFNLKESIIIRDQSMLFKGAVSNVAACSKITGRLFTISPYSFDDGHLCSNDVSTDVQCSVI